MSRRTNSWNNMSWRISALPLQISFSTFFLFVSFSVSFSFSFLLILLLSYNILLIPYYDLILMSVMSLQFSTLRFLPHTHTRISTLSIQEYCPYFFAICLSPSDAVSLGRRLCHRNAVQIYALHYDTFCQLSSGHIEGVVNEWMSRCAGAGHACLLS